MYLQVDDEDDENSNVNIKFFGNEGKQVRNHSTTENNQYKE